MKSPKILLAAELAMILSISSSQVCADPSASITASGGVAPLGGSINLPQQSFDQSNPNATAASTPVGKSIGLTEPDGSYADAYALAGFGQLHAYSDAHRTYDNGYSTEGDAQSTATAKFDDYLLASDNDPSINYVNYMLTLNLTGSHTSEDAHNYPGYTAQAQLSWDIRNNATGFVYSSGVFDTTDISPNLSQHVPITAPANTLLSIEVSLSTDTYVTSTDAAQYLTAVADYKDTLIVNLDAVTAGANTIGVSGFDYATAVVPLPNSALCLLTGLGFLNARKCRRIIRVQP